MTGVQTCALPILAGIRRLGDPGGEAGGKWGWREGTGKKVAQKRQKGGRVAQVQELERLVYAAEWRWVSAAIG